MQSNLTSYHPYMHQWQIIDVDELPLPNQKRKKTDVCCGIIGVIFGLILFILAFILLNKSHLTKIQYPADSQGNLCMIGTDKNGTNYPFLYFNNIKNTAVQRYCVEQCPQVEVKPHCFTNCTIGYYPTVPTDSRLGAFCLPQDENAKSKLLYHSKMHLKWNSIKAKDYLLMAVGISVGISLIWMLLVQFLPRIAIWIGFILAIILLLIAAIIFFTSAKSYLYDAGDWSILMGIICVIFLIILLGYIILHRSKIALCGRFLEVAGQSLCANITKFLYIPLFIAITFLFGILLVFQYLAFNSTQQPHFDKSQIYYTTTKNFILTVLLVIQAIWGLSFFRDTFNYIISGHTVDWYFQQQYNCSRPVSYFFRKNFGSVAGGSFITGFLYLPTLIVSFFCPGADCCFCNCLDMARSDTYAYIYLTGNSYCPSVRQVQYLCYRSKICRQNQSILFLYSFAIRVTISLATILIIFWISRDNMALESIPPYLLVGVFFVCLYISCYFVDIHVHAAEALSVCLLAEYDVEYGCGQQMKKCPKNLRELVNDLQKQIPDKNIK